MSLAKTTIAAYRSGLATTRIALAEPDLHKFSQARYEAVAFFEVKPAIANTRRSVHLLGCSNGIITMPQKATIYHNPNCGTSRKTLEILRDSGFDVWIREYLKNPPTRDELKDLYDRAGITPREGLRSKEPLASELGLTNPAVDGETILDAMIANPILIERPLVETPKGVRLCRPQDKVQEII
jgi:arsenate reductase